MRRSGPAISTGGRAVLRSPAPLPDGRGGVAAARVSEHTNVERFSMAVMPPGIPRIADYERARSCEPFLGMERFSEAFLRGNRLRLASYRRRWVADPLHQWSRQWEYPYAFESLRQFALDSPGGFRILDAGSGITFFPWFVASRLAGASVECCDRDRAVEATFGALQVPRGDAVRFRRASLERLPYERGEFDAVTCISVLEHCADPSAVIAGFHDVLRPGGILVVTFDLSLDDRSELSPERAALFLSRLEDSFEPLTALDAGSLPSALAQADLLTTRYFLE